jgi:co-chaperonin GroES (HSP10)
MNIEEMEDKGIDFDTFDQDAEIAKFEDIEALGYNIIVRLYTSPKVTKGGFIIPDKTHDHEKFSNFCGLVVAVSEASYKDPERYKYNTKPLCKVGDWITFPRHAGHRINFKGLPVFVLDDECPTARIKDPAKSIGKFSR